jgi:hypothetical protein
MQTRATMCCSALARLWFRMLVAPAHLAVFGAARLEANVWVFVYTRVLSPSTPVSP